MANLKIKHKILLLFLFISLAPLAAQNLLLISSTQRQLKQTAYDRQNLIASENAERVDNFLATKVDTLIFQSQANAVSSFNVPTANLNLAAMTKLDRDIRRVSLIDKSGNEQVVVNQSGLLAKHANVASDDAFKSTTFLAGKEYIGPVQYDQNTPYVIIAVPLIRFTEQQDLSHLSTAEFGKYRSPDDIVGVLEAEYSMSDLWQSVLSAKIDQAGYTYVVDDKGNLIAHPDSNFLKTHQNLAHVHQVSDFLHNVHDEHESISETGNRVVSTFHQITRTSWGVIVEEPVSTIYATTNTYRNLGITILIAVTIIVLILSFILRKQLLTPIRELAAGAKRIGSGDFDYKLPVKNRDELGNLAENFNKMGQDLARVVTSLREKNITLVAEHNKLNRIIESVTDGIIALDRDRQIVSINPPAAKLVGKQPADLIYKSSVVDFQWTQNDKIVQLELEKPGIYLYEGLLLQHGEQVSYVNLVVVVLEQTSDDIAAIITIHDLTQSRELEVMKLDFVAIAAHELRTPLTFMRGYLNLLSQEAAHELSGIQAEYLRRAMVGVEQLGNLINNLLNVSRVERGVMQIDKTKLDLTRLLQQVVDQQRVTAKLKHQTINYVAPSNTVFVPADRSAISEVINNLLNNAIKYAPDGGQIDVNLALLGNMARVEIQDNGIGIPKNAQSHLFTKFYRVEHSLTTGNRGTGLGLYISKAIIDLHQGQIGFSSQEGQGSTFFFTLPLFERIKDGKLDKIDNKELIGVHGWLAKDITD